VARVRYRGSLETVEGYVCLLLPEAVGVKLGDTYRVPVKGTVGRHPVRTSVFRQRDGRRMLIVNKAMQRGAGIGAGDLVTVVLEVDAAPRAVSLPAELEQALTRSRRARAAFEGLPPSHKKRYADWVGEAKRAQTRIRRAEEALRRLLAG
jgi:bacteriocin resistance YdeI/OmpD-like protein/uncharacterized protein DUF1905